MQIESPAEEPQIGFPLIESDFMLLIKSCIKETRPSQSMLALECNLKDGKDDFANTRQGDCTPPDRWS